jgi:hypothetical protein
MDIFRKLKGLVFALNSQNPLYLRKNKAKGLHCQPSPNVAAALSLTNPPDRAKNL